MAVVLVLTWIAFEMIGLYIGYSISRNLALAGLLGFACAVGAYLLVNYRLEQIPNKSKPEDWMDRIGKQDDN